MRFLKRYLILLGMSTLSAFLSMNGAELFVTHSIFYIVCGSIQGGSALIIFACVIAEMVR